MMGHHQWRLWWRVIIGRPQYKGLGQELSWGRLLLGGVYVRLSEDKVLYKAWTTSSPLILQIECPDVDLVKPIPDKLYLGGIIGDDPDNVILRFPVQLVLLNTWIHWLCMLMILANSPKPVLRLFSVVLWYLTQWNDLGYLLSGLTSWTITSQSTFKWKWLQVDNTLLGEELFWENQKLVMTLQSIVHLPGYDYHMPKADICLEFPQSDIWAIMCTGHVIVNG